MSFFNSKSLPEVLNSPVSRRYSRLVVRGKRRRTPAVAVVVSIFDASVTFGISAWLLYGPFDNKHNQVPLSRYLSK